MTIPESYRRLEGSERHVAIGARRVRAADPNEMLSITIYVRRRPDAPPLPDQEYWAAHPPGRRQFVAREEFAERYGATQTDLDRVVDFSKANGLFVVEEKPAQRSVVVSGTVLEMTKAFGIGLYNYESPTESYRGYEGYIHLPNDLVGIVEGVFGLDNRRVAQRGGGGAPPGAWPLTPPQVAKLFDFPNWNAAGQTIGIIELGGGLVTDGGNIPTDIDAFFQGLGLTTPSLTVVSIDGAINNIADTNSDSEVALDIDVAGAIAQSAKIVVYFAPNTDQGFLDAIFAALADGTNLPSVLSISWGRPEATWTESAINAMTGAFQSAAALGVTVFASTGDSGSGWGVGDGNAHVGYPASDPWVTACGGTFISNVAGPVFTEGTWNDGFGVTAGATGGGISDVFVLPPWQTGVGVPPSKNPGNAQNRGIPDIAGNASPFSGYTIVLSGQPATFGGTSAVAPLYAGLVALINADLGEPVGYLNPTLYQIGKTPGQKVFRDINDGANNAWSDEVVPAPSFTSVPGWDACTGWGSINGNALVLALIEAKENPVDNSINADNPFNFSQWLNVETVTDPITQIVTVAVGADDNGDDMEVARNNYGDDGFSTWITSKCPENATFVADNFISDTVEENEACRGSVGLFGRSRGLHGAMGVAGESSTGCGVYGIATTGLKGVPPVPVIGIGVVGRAMGGLAVEDSPLEEILGEPIGVLGNSLDGPGVRGHGGPLLTLLHPSQPLQTVMAAPGGVFSSGQLQEELISGNQSLQHVVSLDALSQLRLTPSASKILPTTGQIGDFFVTFYNDGRNVCHLWICTDMNTKGPLWQSVPLGSSKHQGGTPA